MIIGDIGIMPCGCKWTVLQWIVSYIFICHSMEQVDSARESEFAAWLSSDVVNVTQHLLKRCCDCDTTSAQVML